ncbi:MAG TPA: hypothetical protein VNA17_05905 [Pyrinomonadaceae bacterium]|nr:hypothetical protein [Pyrinomonadaceae bacterium]
MKKLLLILSVAWGAVLGTSAFAQEPATDTPPPRPRVMTATMAVPLPMPPAVDVDIREQPDSPIHLAIDEGIKGRMPGTPLKVRNDGGSTVAGYVLRVDVEPYGLNQMVILGSKGLAAGDARVQPLPMPNMREGTAKPVVSVDHVQFTDGRTWGPDTLAKSKHIAAYLKGRNEALARVQEMLAGQDATDINRAFEVFSSSSFAEPNLPTGRPPRFIDYGTRGYEEVINILRRMPRSTELSQDLARRLEIMIRKADQ